MRFAAARSLFLVAFALAAFGSSLHAQPFDLLLKGGIVIDGTGGAPFEADVGVRDGRIAEIGRLSPEGASRTIDVSGLYVTPGFIDLHSHAESGLSDPYLADAVNNLTQGITTVVLGQDGRHAWPLGGSLGDQVDLWRRQGIGNNIVPLAGHGNVRFEVMGYSTEPASPEQRKAIAARVEKLLEDGVWGLSSGLSYEPGRYAPPDEVVDAARPLARFDGFYTSHLRDQGEDLIPSIEETILLSHEVGARGVVTHIKASGAKNWGKSREAVALLEKARAQGVEIYADLYPYETSNDGIDVSLVPVQAIFSTEELRGLIAPSGASPAELVRWAYRIDPALRYTVQQEVLVERPERGMEIALAASSWVEEQPIYRRRLRDVIFDPKKGPELLSFVERLLEIPGGAGRIEITFHPEESLVGRTLADVAETRGATPPLAAVQLTLEGAHFTMLHLSEKDVVHFIQQPFVAGGTDGGIPEYGAGYVHPRSYGTFARRIRRYVFDTGVIELPFAIRTATGLPAEIVGLADRGLLVEGYWADVIAFDPRRIRDNATYRSPHRLSEGIEWVLVNGEISVENGENVKHRAGRVLLKNEGRSAGASR